MRRVVLTPAAAADIESIWDFIAHDSVNRADHVVEEISGAISALAEMPGMGHARDDLADETLRVWPVYSYLIVYRELNPLEVVRVVSGYRDLAALFARD